MKGIDPKYIMWLGLAVSIEQAIGHGTVSLTNVVPASWAPYVTSWCNLLAFIGTAIMTYQAAVSGPQTGPLLPSTELPKSTLVKTDTVVKILLIAFALSFLVAGNSAQAAQSFKPRTVAAKSASGSTVTKSAAIANPITVLQTFTVSDLQAALSDAQANHDAAATACYTALLPIVQSGVGNPFPTGLGGFQLLQKARDAKAMVAALNSPTGPLANLNMACAPLIVDAQNTLIQLGIIGGGVLAAGATGGITLPGLTALIPGL